MINDQNYLHELFINEAKPALDRHSIGGNGGGDPADNTLVLSIIERSIAEVPSDLERIGPYAFAGCQNITSVNLPRLTSLVGYEFYKCQGLTSVNLPLVTDIGNGTFYGCDNLTAVTDVNLPSATSIGNSAFYGCQGLTSVNLTLVTDIGTGAFYNCTSLTDVNFPSATSIGNSAFYGCQGLTAIDFLAVTSIGSSVFQNCINLNALILRSDTKCTLGSNSSFNGTALRSSGYIYVPSALVDSYKTTGGWSILSSRFRALEDYTVDGTIYGALDETKI